MRVYVLIDPVTREIRYVGKTKSALPARLRQHLREAAGESTSHKSNWIRSLGGEPPIATVYCEVPDGYDVDEIERQAIAVLRRAGHRLTNMTEGGDGGWSDAARAAAAKARKPASPETRAKLSAASKGRKHGEAARAKIMAARSRQKMRPVSDEAKAKISKALTGKSNGGGWKLSPETRARQSAARRKRDEEGQ